MNKLLPIFIILSSVVFMNTSNAQEKLKALIIDGQNNHIVWPKSTLMLKQYLEETNLFEVSIERTQYTWRANKYINWLPLANVGETEDLPDPKSDPEFNPTFSDYDVVISNFGNQAADWPEATQAAFDAYLKAGGGFVSVHAADNSFGSWEAYNLAIGLGGWGGRANDFGTYVYYTNEGELTRDPTPGKCGKHGKKHAFPITVRVTDHPITQGMPAVWLSGEDECYALLRGPAENMTILATGKDQSEAAPTDRHEPILMVIDYGEGRIFHTTLGHAEPGLQNVGFITSFTRGAEWAATGTVTQPIPADFPTAENATERAFALKKN